MPDSSLNALSDAVSEAEGMPVRRSPIVTVELPFDPPVPEEAEPYWWGNHHLTFRVDGVPVWESQIPEAAWSKGRSAHVKKVDGFGWVLVLTQMHDDARDSLSKLFLPDHAGEPSACDNKGFGHASAWSYWGEERVK